MADTVRIIISTSPAVVERLTEQASLLGVSRSAYCSILLGQGSLSAQAAWNAMPDAMKAAAQRIVDADKEHDETTP